MKRARREERKKEKEKTGHSSQSAIVDGHFGILAGVVRFGVDVCVLGRHLLL